MISNNKQAAARRFVETWKGRGYEKGDTQPFWYQLLHDVFGIEVPANFVQFELPVHLKNTKFIVTSSLSRFTIWNSSKLSQWKCLTITEVLSTTILVFTKQHKRM